MGEAPKVFSVALSAPRAQPKGPHPIYPVFFGTTNSV